MNNWMTAVVSGDLREVPGIGEAAVAKLGSLDEPITNFYMLLGHYLKLKGPDTFNKETGEVETVDIMVHNDKFWLFLKEAGITAHRSAIVKAVAMKANSLLPGLYDPNLYEEDDEEDEE